MNPIEIMKTLMEIVEGEREFEDKLLKMIDERNKAVLKALKKIKP